MPKRTNSLGHCVPFPSVIPWNVAEVEALSNFCLRVRFLGGLQGIVDLKAFLHAPDAGVFSTLTEPERFTTVTVERGSVTWPNVLNAWPWYLDLDPRVMHDEIARNGVWVL